MNDRHSYIHFRPKEGCGFWTTKVTKFVLLPEAPPPPFRSTLPFLPSGAAHPGRHVVGGGEHVDLVGEERDVVHGGRVPPHKAHEPDLAGPHLREPARRLRGSFLPAFGHPCSMAARVAYSAEVRVFWPMATLLL